MKEKFIKLWKSKTFRIVILLLGALILLLLIWRVFFKSDSTAAGNVYSASEQEERLSLILSRIEGVENATVMIGEENGVPVSVVIVFEGADSLLTRLRVMEVAANALRIEKGKVLVYPAEKK